MNQEMLRDRAEMMRRSRLFFSERGIMEVDCPTLTEAPSIDAHIDVIQSDTGYLHTSPEYCMKRLLAGGIGDIYQLGHVFRKGELGCRHRPEFMMAEWYRIGMPYEQMIEETLDYIRLFIGEMPAVSITYEQAFQRYAGIDYRIKTDDELNIILGTEVEPNFHDLTVLRDYPASQCALAQTEGEVAKRFEVYYRGIELANGYHELADALEQRRRFEASNEERLRLGKEAYPIDEPFLKALEKGLPDCCGVAVGFDRLMMVRHGADTIDAVLPF
jgi:lysyl-tRNA synthetase class 2